MPARKVIDKHKQLYDAVGKDEVETKRGADVNTRDGIWVCVVSSNVCIVQNCQPAESKCVGLQGENTGE